MLNKKKVLKKFITNFEREKMMEKETFRIVLVMMVWFHHWTEEKIRKNGLLFLQRCMVWIFGFLFWLLQLQTQFNETLVTVRPWWLRMLRIVCMENRMQIAEQQYEADWFFCVYLNKMNKLFNFIEQHT